MGRELPNPVVTFLPVHGHRVLMYRRPADEANYPGLWAFPGGKVEIGETFLDALQRELAEETCLTPTGDVALLDSYWFGQSVGIAFAVGVSDSEIPNNAELRETVWVSSADEFRGLQRIPGIDNHFERLRTVLANPDRWESIDALNLTPDRYLNL